jgi:hypothetical protein
MAATRRGSSSPRWVTCELGPKPYAITGPDGNDTTDRCREALTLKASIEAIWNNVVIGAHSARRLVDSIDAEKRNTAAKFESFWQAVYKRTRRGRGVSWVI